MSKLVWKRKPGWFWFRAEHYTVFRLIGVWRCDFGKGDIREYPDRTSAKQAAQEDWDAKLLTDKL